MTRVSVVKIYDTSNGVSAVASVEFNGCDPYKVVKLFQDRKFGVDVVADFTNTLREMVNNMPKGGSPYSEVVLTTANIDHLHELVFDCTEEYDKNHDVAVLEMITSDFVIVVNTSSRTYQIHEYCGDYVEVGTDEILVFDGTYQSVVVKMR